MTHAELVQRLTTCLKTLDAESLEQVANALWAKDTVSHQGNGTYSITNPPLLAWKQIGTAKPYTVWRLSDELGNAYVVTHGETPTTNGGFRGLEPLLKAKGLTLDNYVPG